MKKKTWTPVQGETFYFIYPIQSHYPSIASDMAKNHTIDINHPEYVLTIGDAECVDSDVDTITNCFRTKTQAKRALKTIKEALRFTGRIM